MERVILMSPDEKVGRLVEQLKRDFEKYHTCAAIRKHHLAEPSDGQKVAQTLGDKVCLIVVLDEALFAILDHKESRRLSYKIRDLSKSNRVIFVRYLVEMDMIKEFLEDITEDQVNEMLDFNINNIPLIAQQFLKLSSMNRRATESEENMSLVKGDWNFANNLNDIPEIVLSSRDLSLEKAAKDMSTDWRPLDKDSIYKDDYTRNAQASDPRESHDSISVNSLSDLGSSSSSEGETVRLAQNIPPEENVQPGLFPRKLSSKLQVELPKNDGGRPPGTCDSPNLQMTARASVPKAMPAGCLQGFDNNGRPETINPTCQSLPHQTQRWIPPERQERTSRSVDGDGAFQKVLIIPSQFGVMEERSHPPQFTPERQNQIPSQNLPLTNVNYPQAEEPRPIFSVPTQESCNLDELRAGGNRLSQCELAQREQDLDHSFTTSYHQVNQYSCSNSGTNIRCQKCNQIKDKVMLYSVAPHQMGLASVTSIHCCPSMPNSSGPQAMTFSYSLCLECSEDSSFSSSPFRQNSFCGTNDTVHSSNLFPFNHSQSAPTLGPLEQQRCTSNIEKGFQPCTPFTHHESSPEINQPSMNNFSDPAFRQEILRIDQNMRQVQMQHRNIPVQSGGLQPSNSDNTQTRPVSVPSSSQKTGFQNNHSRTTQVARHCPTCSLPTDERRRSNGGASSESQSKSFQQAANDSEAGASAAFHDYDHIPLTELSHFVIEEVQSMMDYSHSSHLNWQKLAHLHGWNFSMIDKIKQKWHKKVIESPFLELIQNSTHFQNYTYGQLKEDLEKIPRKDILEKLRDFEEKGKVLV